MAHDCVNGFGRIAWRNRGNGIQARKKVHLALHLWTNNLLCGFFFGEVLCDHLRVNGRILPALWGKNALLGEIHCRMLFYCPHFCLGVLLVAGFYADCVYRDVQAIEYELGGEYICLENSRVPYIRTCRGNDS